MVAVFDVVVNIGANEMFIKGIGYVDIVDSPALVLCAYAGETLAPPAITVGFGMKAAETVRPAGSKEFVHPGTFFGQETRRLFIAFGIMDIDFLVRDIIIAAKD